MPIRLLEASDVPRWIELPAELGPYESPALAAEPPMAAFVGEEKTTLVGFLKLSLRSYAEGCASSTVPYVKGWYVAADWHLRGVNGAMMGAAAG
jgi:hypothetical protein